MDNHPLLNELLQLCATHNLEPARGYTTFEIYQELSEVRKLADLNYFFNTELNLFYLTGKQEPTDETFNVYVPVRFNDEITLHEINSIQQALSPEHKEIYLFIRDADSSSTCYCITNGLVKPDSPETSKYKKEIEGKKYQFEKTIEKNRKLFYAKALKEKQSTGKDSEE